MNPNQIWDAIASTGSVAWQFFNAAWAYISVPIGAVLPSFYHWCRISFRRKPDIRKILGFSPEEKKIFISPTMYSERLYQEEFERLATAYEGIYSYERLRNMLATVSEQEKSSTITLSESVNNDDLKKHIILIGGPIYNSYSSDQLRAVDKWCDFEGRSIVFKRRGLRFESSGSIENGIRDYALLISSNSVWEEGKRCVSVMGIRTFSTMGVPWALTNSQFRAQLAALVRKNRAKQWAACISIFARRSLSNSNIYSLPIIEHFEKIE